MNQSWKIWNLLWLKDHYKITENFNKKNWKLKLKCSKDSSFFNEIFNFENNWTQTQEQESNYSYVSSST